MLIIWEYHNIIPAKHILQLFITLFSCHFFVIWHVKFDYRRNKPSFSNFCAHCLDRTRYFILIMITIQHVLCRFYLSLVYWCKMSKPLSFVCCFMNNLSRILFSFHRSLSSRIIDLALMTSLPMFFHGNIVLPLIWKLLFVVLLLNHFGMVFKFVLDKLVFMSSFLYSWLIKHI